METQPESSDLIAFKLGELTKAVDKGFSALDFRLNEMDKRIRELEIWQAGAQASSRTNTRFNMSMTQIIIIILGILGISVGALAQVIK